MLSIDLHVHSSFSACGLHSFMELLDHGRRIGLKAMAITDHGLAVGGGRLTSVFFERFKPPFDDIKLYKGIEHNVVDEQGNVDIMWQFMPFIDILLLGVHPNLPHNKSRQQYTGMLLAAMEKHPFIDIISHPNDPLYPLDYRLVAGMAKKLGMAVELNNSKVLYARTGMEETMDLIRACKETGCFLCVNSDTHAIGELGGDEAVRPLLEKVKYRQELVVNRDLDAAAAFIEGRRGLKKEAVRARTKKNA